MTKQKFTQDDINVRLHVQLGFVLTVGLYDGPINNKMIAEHVKEMLSHGTIEQFIENVQIDDTLTPEGSEFLGFSGRLGQRLATHRQSGCP